MHFLYTREAQNRSWAPAIAHKGCQKRLLPVSKSYQRKFCRKGVLSQSYRENKPFHQNIRGPAFER